MTAGKEKIIWLDSAESTNAYAMNTLCDSRPPEGTVIATLNQTKGRGTDDNSWESEPGKNLTFSVILYPQMSADKQFIMNKAVSTGIYDYLASEMSDAEVSIKWPNDIYISDKKICGILIQNSVKGDQFDFVIVGIGLNVNQLVFKSDAPNPVSMQMITGKHYNLDIVLENLLFALNKRYQQFISGEVNRIEADYESKLYRLLEWHQFSVGGKTLTAKITGAGKYGHLLLETSTNKMIECDMKDVKFLI